MNRNYVIVSLMDRLFVSMPRDSYCVSHTALYRQGLIAPDPTFTASRLRDAWALWFRQHHPEKDRLIQNLEARGTFLDLEVYAFFPEMYKKAVLVDHLVREEGEWVYRTAEATGEIYGTDLPDWQATAWRFLYHHEEQHMYVPIQPDEAPQGLVFTKNQLKLIDDEHLMRFTLDIQKCTGPRRNGEAAEGMLVKKIMVPHDKHSLVEEILRKLQSKQYRKQMGRQTTQVDGVDLQESEPKRPRPNDGGETAEDLQGYVMTWPGVVGAFEPGDRSALLLASNPTICVHCLTGLPHRHSNAQRTLGLGDPKPSVSGEPSSGLELVLDEDCIENPLLLQADYAEVNALWYSALDNQEPTKSLAKWRAYFNAQWLTMTDEQKLLYLLSRKARPLILRARAEPAWWPKDDKDKDGPPVLVAGGGSFKSSPPKTGGLRAAAIYFGEKDKNLMEIDRFEFPSTMNSLIKSERVIPGAHHDGLTPLIPVLNLTSPDAEKLRPAKALNLLKVVTSVSNDTVLLIFLLKKKKINC